MVFHKIRRCYGWTDATIVEHIEAYGSQWVLDTYKLISEDEASDKRWLLNVAQAGMTPMDQKSGRNLKRYVTKLHRMLDKMIPWKSKAKINRLLKLKEKGPSGDEALRQSEAFAKRFKL